LLVGFNYIRYGPFDTADLAIAGHQPGRMILKYGRTFILGVLNGVLFNLAEALMGGTTILPLFISALTDSKVLVGLAGTMNQAGWYMPQFVVAGFIEHLRRKKPVYVWAGLVRGITIWTIAVLVPITAGSRAGLFLVVFFLLYSVYTLGAGVAGISFMDIVAKSIPSTRRGTFFGARLAFGGLLSALAGLFVRNVLNSRPFPDNFAVLFIAAAVVVTIAIMSFSLVHEPEAAVNEVRIPFRRFLRRGPALLRNNRSYRMFFIVRVLLSVWSMALPFYILFALDELRLDPGTAGVFLSVQMVGFVISNILWGSLSNRIGNKIVLVLVSGVAVLSPVLAILSNRIMWLGSTWSFGIVFFLLGFTLSGVRLGQTNYMLDVSPEAERPTYLGFMNTFLAPVLLLSMLGGYIIEKASFETLFFAVMGAAALALVLSIRLEEPRLAWKTP
jgi:MFS family permease